MGCGLRGRSRCRPAVELLSGWSVQSVPPRWRLLPERERRQGTTISPFLWVITRSVTVITWCGAVDRLVELAVDSSSRPCACLPVVNTRSGSVDADSAVAVQLAPSSSVVSTRPKLRTTTSRPSCTRPSALARSAIPGVDGKPPPCAQVEPPEDPDVALGHDQGPLIRGHDDAAEVEALARDRRLASTQVRLSTVPCCRRRGTPAARWNWSSTPRHPADVTGR